MSHKSSPPTTAGTRNHSSGHGRLAMDDAQMPCLRLVRSSRWIRRLAKWLLFLMAVATVMLAAAPWQQSVTGTGNVIAYAPNERQQPIEAPIEGKIVRWGERIVDNAHVDKGDLICEIQDIDPLLMNRLQDQLRATERSLETARNHFDASQRNLDAARTIISAYELQVTAYRNVKEQTVAAAQDYVEQAEEKHKSAQKQLEEIQAELPQAKAQFLRQKTLAEEKISSVLKFQEAEFKYNAVVAKVEKNVFDVAAAKQEIEAKIRDRDSKEQKAQADVEYATAMLRKAAADVAKSEAELAKSENEVTKAEKDLSKMQVELSRQHSQRVIAPMDGFVVQIVANQGSQLVKEGETLCIIVPDSAERAVQIWVDGNDASLLEPGRHVRLQFEGWPAVQFAGWPSVAVGTFGGTVSSVDSIDDGRGQFRTLVVPDETDGPWPPARYLRQGVRTNAWVLLNQVPLWFEVWRRMNGFPAIGSKAAPDMGKDKADTGVKLGKSGGK